MKRSLLIITAAFGLLPAIQSAKAETLEEFLKRTGCGDASKDDLHENFHGFVFIGAQSAEFDRKKFLQLQDEQKAIGAKATVNGLTILSKTETPLADGKGTLVSVVSKAEQTLRIGNSMVTTQSVNHDIIIRGVDGKFVALFLAAKQ